MNEDLENNRFINIHIGLNSSSSTIIPTKSILKEYSDELGWFVEVDKKGQVIENGERVYSIDIKPKDGKISPEELREKRDHIKGFAIGILRDVLYKDRINELPETVFAEYMTGRESGQKPWIIEIVFAKTLFIECELAKMIKLQQYNPNLVKNIFFEINPREMYKENIKKVKSIFVRKQEKEKAEFWIKALEDSGINSEIPSREEWEKRVEKRSSNIDKRALEEEYKKQEEAREKRIKQYLKEYNKKQK